MKSSEDGVFTLDLVGRLREQCTSRFLAQYEALRPEEQVSLDSSVIFSAHFASVRKYVGFDCNRLGKIQISRRIPYLPELEAMVRGKSIHQIVNAP